MTGCADCSKPQSVAPWPWRCSESSLLTRMWWLGPLAAAGRVPTATTRSTFAHLREGCLLWKGGLKKSSYLGKLGKGSLSPGCSNHSAAGLTARCISIPPFAPLLLHQAGHNVLGTRRWLDPEGPQHSRGQELPKSLQGTR